PSIADRRRIAMPKARAPDDAPEPDRALVTSDAATNPDERHQVTALARGLAILQCFTTTRKQLGSAEIARLTALPQPTVWRLCRTLVQAGFLGVAPGTQRLQLGASVLALGFAASAAFDI